MEYTDEMLQNPAEQRGAQHHTAASDKDLSWTPAQEITDQKNNQGIELKRELWVSLARTLLSFSLGFLLS